MFGKYIDEDDINSYQNRAISEGYVYFELEDWQEANDMVGGKKSEMWKINKKFIDNHQGKEFYLSHNPFDTNNYKGYYKDELDYLTGSNLENNFDGKIEQINEKLWKINF